jgi:exosome complex component CSL4
VESVSNDLAFIDIISVEKSNGVQKTDFTGIIHISQTRREYLESMYDAFRIGDLIRARVLNNTNPFQLTTKEPSLGVVVAFCTRCGSILKKSDDRLVCPICGNVEKRKISIMYYFR